MLILNFTNIFSAFNKYQPMNTICIQFFLLFQNKTKAEITINKLHLSNITKDLTNRQAIPRCWRQNMLSKRF